MIRVNFKQFQKQTQVFICSKLQFLLLIIRKWLGKKHHKIGSKLSSLEFTRLKLGYESQKRTKKDKKDSLQYINFGPRAILPLRSTIKPMFFSSPGKYWKVLEFEKSSGKTWRVLEFC